MGARRGTRGFAIALVGAPALVVALSAVVNSPVARAATSTTHTSCRASLIRITGDLPQEPIVANNPNPDGEECASSSGTAVTTTLPGGLGSASAVGVRTDAQPATLTNGHTADAAVGGVVITLPGFTITADVLTAHSQVQCVAGKRKPNYSGSSQVGSVTVNGTPVVASPNHTVHLDSSTSMTFEATEMPTLLDGTIVLIERALVIDAPDRSIVVSEAKAGATPDCPVPPPPCDPTSDPPCCPTVSVPDSPSATHTPGHTSHLTANGGATPSAVPRGDENPCCTAGESIEGNTGGTDPGNFDGSCGGENGDGGDGD